MSGACASKKPKHAASSALAVHAPCIRPRADPERRTPTRMSWLRRFEDHPTHAWRFLHIQRLSSGEPAASLLPAVRCQAGLPGQVDSLRCFAIPALAASLTQVVLACLSRCLTRDLSQLFGLRSLQSIHVSMLDSAVSASRRNDSRCCKPALRSEAVLSLRQNRLVHRSSFAAWL